MTTQADLQRAARLAAKTLLRFPDVAFVLAHGPHSFRVEPFAIVRSIPSITLLPVSSIASEMPDIAKQLNHVAAPSHGITLPGKDAQGKPLYCIVYRDQMPSASIRFTIAHELGHIALRHTEHILQNPDATQLFSCTPQQELEANCYALHLLVPPAVLRALTKEQQTVYMEQLSACFHVMPRDIMRIHNGSCNAPADTQLDAQITAILHERLQGISLPPVQGSSLHPINIIGYLQ